jgi:chain length determinant protein tyrosine kinase EpsG
MNQITSPADSTGDAHPVDERSIGNIITQAKQLSPEQVNAILSLQRETGKRFGEAAVELGLASPQDVIWALAQQYNYPYRNVTSRSVADELVVANAPFSDHAERFRNLRSQLLIKLGVESGIRHGNVIAVLSADRGDGKTFVAANLAITLAQLGGRVVLVDADMRNARIQRLFEISDRQTGLSEALNGRAEAGLCVPSPDFANLFVLPAGVIPPNPQELVERTSFALLLNNLRNKFDFVIVDTPAADVGIDCVSIAAKCQKVLMVVRAGANSAKTVKQLMQYCARARVEVLGTILNDY